MREFETRVQELKNDVMCAVAKLVWDDRLPEGILDIPEQIIPGPEAKMRCCIYKERAIVGDRIKVAMGKNNCDPEIVGVLSIACDECPVTEITVGPACRGCIANRCAHACPKDAITIVNHKSVIDHSKCILCGRCMNACPYGAITKNLRPCERSCKVGAITMGENRKASIDHSKCIACGACVYQCPFGAIMDKSFLLEAIALLKGAQKGEYPLCAMIAPSIAGQFSVPIGNVVSGLKLLGFTQVSEAAYGADIVAHIEAEELAERGTLTSSCCPAFVSYVEHNFPELRKYVSSTPSPMIMLGRKLKEENPNMRVIFIGPCVAKKQEAREVNNGADIDCAISYEELNALFESKAIVLEELDPQPLDQASSFGRGFAVSGGVSAAVAQVMKETGNDFPLKAVPCSGLDECKIALLKLSKGVLDGNFIEGMACEGGCVQGPVALVHSPKNRAEVAAHAKQASEHTITGA